MNRRMVLHMLGKIIMLEGVLLTLPLIVSFIYHESCALSFMITIAIALVVGPIMSALAKPRNRVMFAKEGFFIVSLAWIFMSLIGALPFFISREIPNYIDAFFEVVSGFTTTGASILTDVESMSRGLLFWRSFTHWIGGMGVLVFIMAIIPSISDRSIHIMRAEMPGPIIGKLVPRARQTAKILYLIYIGLTVAEFLFLLCGEMDCFESILHTFGTAGTGGFGMKADSIASYSSYSQWVITIFMLLFGINFNLYFLLLIGKFKPVFKSTELRLYFCVVAVATAVIAININHMYPSTGDTIRNSIFQVSSIMTTTGYTTADYNLWPSLSKAILVLLMFVGACAGSTAGGIKMSRVIILFKIAKRELKKLLHPRSVNSVTFEGKRLDNVTTTSVCAYFITYMLVTAVVLLIVSIQGLDFETNFTAVVACFNNIGPGLSQVGPAANFAVYNDFTTLVLSITMLLGRLEIYPILLILLPHTWTKKS